MVSDDDYIMYCGCAVSKLHNQWSKMGMHITNWVNILCYKDKLYKSMVTVRKLLK